MNIRSATFDHAKLRRSRVTNGRRMVEGVDSRSREGRRFRDLQIAYADDLGGPDGLSEAQKALVRQAATLQIQAERVQASVLRGEAVDEEQLTRLSNALARVLAALRAKAEPRDAAPSLADYLATHYPAPASSKAEDDHLVAAARKPHEPKAHQRPP
jgi:hypothetical protein